MIDNVMQKAELTLDKAMPYILYKVTEMRVDDAMKQRLRELGMTVGAETCTGMQGYGGEISSYYVRGVQIAFRRETARAITVKRLSHITEGVNGSEARR